MLLQKLLFMISRSTIEKVLEAVRVEEVIQDFVVLKKSGSNYKGLSPFVSEKTPSFMVSPAKQIWKDFSSGKGGNAVSFVMEHEQFSYPEAIRYLAKKYNIEIEETIATDEDKKLQDEKESMFLVNDLAVDFFEKQLWEDEEGKAIGLSYFKERGFREEIIKKFRLGFSPEQWTAFSDYALSKGYKLEYLEKTGLTIVKENNKIFDRFKGRVMFPILSLGGRILGFGGRILTNDKKQAKYLNSPESEIYHKSKVLYGIFQSKQEIVRENKCYLVEGYTDVIQFHQAGIENVVASSGTALTEEQIRLIQRLTSNITVLFDGDSAGIRASMRGIDMILAAGMNVRVCTFPEGEDPDSMAKKMSREELQNYLKNNETDFIKFKVNLLTKDSENDPIKKAEIIREIIVSIAKISDPIKRELYLKECASLMQVSEEVIFNSLSQYIKKEIQSANKKIVEQRKMEISRPTSGSQQKIDSVALLERKLIEILLLYGHVTETFEDEVYMVKNEEVVINFFKRKKLVIEEIFTSLQEDELSLTHSLYSAIYQDILDFYKKNGYWNVSEYLLTAPNEYVVEISNIMLEDEKETLHKWESKNIFVKSKNSTISQLVTETILTFRWCMLNAMVEKLKNKTTLPEAKTHEILPLIIDYLQLSNRFSKKLGRIISRFNI